MDNNKWMIVKKEKMSTKIKNYFKNIFSKIISNQNNKKKKNKKGFWPNKRVEENVIHETIKKEQPVMENKSVKSEKNNKEITIEVQPYKKKPKEIVIEYENKNKPKKKEIVVEYENKKSKVQNDKNPVKIQFETKQINVEVNSLTKKQDKKNEEPQLALKPIKGKAKKEKKPLNIFQLFKEKERKKRKEILNRVRENKMDDYETISTKAKLSKGSIVVDDVDAHELEPLIDLYRDSNKKLRNRIRESQK